MKGDAVFGVIRRWFRGARRGQQDGSVPTQNLPRHVAIIMDGNGRWARRRGLPRAAGHHAGMLAMREVIRACDDAGIECLTLYAFSTENWKRPESEVEYLMRLPEEFFRTEIDELVERGVRVRFIGDVDKLPPYTRDTVDRTLSRTREGTGMTVTFALNYGGRADVLGAVHRVANAIRQGQLTWDDLDEASFAEFLDTAGLPDPDLIIRTSGEKRLSNFLIWQAAYAEFWFTDVLWPDFGRRELFEALTDYGRRKRRFGGLK
ncbi:MAG: isoprenyl transferase [Alicyclobacillus herbarius]|uniref:isoprenyl transferase n=1 Tax=Alicyclobacillus herbarius TaxID=122960 RepID=UPI00042730C1|nr:isoprenyl transferase [Alicyclobacillus herbarius]MCL6632005.1 isoprenyl transferase [Alicyclobacillus herbarius]